jgi:hypothetical protein
MGNEIMAAAESIAAVLKDRGFNKEASIVNEAAWGMGQGVGKWAPSMMQSPGSKPPAPTPPGTTWDRKQDVYTELDPTGQGRHKSVKPLSEIKKEISVMTPETIKYELDFNDQPGVRDYLKNFQSVIRQREIDKLASLGKMLTEKGYETLGRRLFEAAGRLQVA